MMISWTWLLLLQVLYLQHLSFANVFISQIVNGSLMEPWRFNISMFIDELRGVILHCIDSQRNQFGVDIVPDKHKGKFVRFIFNKVFKMEPLGQLCGCDPCGGTMMNLRLRSDKTLIHTRCNNLGEVTLNTFQTAVASDTPNIIYPIPKVIANVSDRIFIMIGNVGPYVGEDNTTIYPFREQMEGCVEKFVHGNTIIKFIGNSSKVRPTCLWRCVSDICNGGMCKERVNQAPLCDCHSTALNGPFCNRSLTVYNRGGNNQYEKVKDSKETYLKMTWKQLLPKMYCLMEIVGEYGHVTVWTNKSHLMIDSSIISDINVDGIKFVNVTIANNILIVTTKNKESKTQFSISQLIRVNIGFSRSSLSCEIFEGAYDIDFSSSQLQNIITPPGQSSTTESTFDAGNMNLIIFGLIFVGCIVVLTMFMILLHLRNKKELNTNIQRFTTLSRQSFADQSRIFTESGGYGKADDKGVYEYIEEACAYSAVNV